MAQLSLPSGETVDVPDEQLPDVLASGKYGAPTQPIQMLDSDGKPQIVDPSSVQSAVAQGWKPVGKAEAQHAQDLQEAAEHPLEAGAEGFGRGFLPGASSLEQGLGISSKANQQLRAEANPTAATVGQVAGNVGQIAAVTALTGGVGDVAEGAAAGAEGADSIFNAGKMAKSAAEFGTQNTVNELNEEDLGDKGFNGEALASAGLGGAILGAASEPVFGLAGKVVPKIITSASDAIAKASDGMANLVGKAALKGRGDIVEAAGQDAFKSALDQTYSDATLGVKNAGRELPNSIARDQSDNINNALEQNYDLRQKVTTDLFPKAIDSTMGNVPLNQAKSGIDAYVANNLSPALSRISGLVEKDAFTPAIQDQLENAVKTFSDSYQDAQNTPEAFNALRKLRIEIDPIMKYGTNIANATDQSSVKFIESAIQSPLRDTLTNPDVFGKAGTDVVRTFNAATKAQIDAEQALVTKLGGKDLFSGSVRPQKEIKAQKLLQLFRGADRVAQDDASESFSNYIQKSKDYIDASHEIALQAGASIDNENLQALLKTSAEKNNQGIAAAMAGRRPEWAQGRLQPLGVGLLGSAAGIPGAAAIGAGLQAGKAIYDTAISPNAALQTLGMIKRISSKYQAQIGAGAASFLKGTVKPLATVGALNASRAFGAGAGVGGNGDAYSQRTSEIKNLASNPQLLQQTLIRNTQGLADAPGHQMSTQSAAMARLGVLHAAIPPSPPPSILSEPHVPNAEEVSKYERVYAAVTEPVKTIYQGMSNGLLTQDQIDAVAQSSPKTLASIRDALQNEIVDKPSRVYTTIQKQMLSMVLGVPVTPEFGHDQLAFQQSTFAPSGPPPGPVNGNPGTSGKTREKGLDNLKIAQSTALPGQARTIERNS